MKELDGDLWRYHDAGELVVITTNGTIKRNGEAVMGRGVARDCARRYPFVPHMLGTLLKENGNHCLWLASNYMPPIITFPVKDDWWETASPGLIVRSAKELVDIADQDQIKKVYLPRPGCGNGGLQWNYVRPLIVDILDDRFTVVWRPQ